MQNKRIFTIIPHRNDTNPGTAVFFDKLHIILGFFRQVVKRPAFLEDLFPAPEMVEHRFRGIQVFYGRGEFLGYLTVDVVRDTGFNIIQGIIYVKMGQYEIIN